MIQGWGFAWDVVIGLAAWSLVVLKEGAPKGQKWSLAPGLGRESLVLGLGLSLER